ncbi:MAG TPA: adenosylmethionine--8-amino-7-oxononanoate transaminase [Crocinitomix sp.]|nr:adenosylmethionine--8-amino-7-oxononanoate transaminase [Crocinitomix sp.]
MNLIQKDKQYVWHPFTQAKTANDPLVIVKGKDAWVYDENGKKYLDANSSWWTIIHGHGNTYIADKINQQFLTLDHSVFAGVTHPKAIESAQKIVNILPDNFSKVFFSDNGSTAVEVALKMVFQYWYNKGVHKKKIIAIEGSYHGDTFGSMSVSQRGYFNQPFEHLFFEVDFIPFPTSDNIDNVLKKMKTLVNSEQVAGFIFEPLVQGASGMRMYAPKILDQLLQIAKSKNVLCIADEVMTGFYRTGTMFAINQIQEKPDIICLSKGITGGVLPIGFTIATQTIFDAFLSDDTTKALLHGHSFTANPISCSAVCANIELLQQKKIQQQISNIVKQHQLFALEIKQHPMVAEVRQTGTILAIELHNQAGTTYFSNLKDKAYQYFIQRGLLLRPLGNVIFINPPYCISKNELEFAYQIITDFLNN